MPKSFISFANLKNGVCLCVVEKTILMPLKVDLKFFVFVHKTAFKVDFENKSSFQFR